MIPNYYPSLFQRSFQMLKSIQWGTLLEGTQKTLGVINQAIPIAYQVKPMMQNAKTLFRIANVMKEDEPIKTIKKEEDKTSSSKPIFYL